MSERLASGPQLYVLNRAGRIIILPRGETAAPTTNTQADTAIKASMAEQEDPPGLPEHAG